ncbi:low temperature requirement protein A [Pseudanabaena sp. PCC 6802]|uniref:low temperature requirement protein A n=1 Tax=Pseudanabaena sp. PCC 6802 TaxID=118173 RepID=UPI000349FE17|nr:low temperature requirement protein A [Pseudanabaena sp. PCC 6802]
MKHLWQPPKLRVSEEDGEERHATWLELFYDLVFVVVIAQLAHHLKDHPSAAGFTEFAVVFVPVWWSWVGTTFYATRFDTDDTLHRVLTVIQMSAIAAMAVNIHKGMDYASVGFALSYVIVRGILVIQYLVAGQHIAIARPLTNRYAKGFGLAAAIWALSTLVSIPWRFGMWCLGMVIDFATPIGAGKLHGQIAPHASHLPERFGLFTLIVLGESIVAVVGGLAAQKWEFAAIVAGVLGLCIAASVWWVYFDNLDGSAIRSARLGQVGTYQIWLYAHLPLVASLTAMGVGMQKLLSGNMSAALPDENRWLLCLALAICYAALGFIHLSTDAGSLRRSQTQALERFSAAILLSLIAWLGWNLSPLTLMFLLAAICISQVVLAHFGMHHIKPEEIGE